MRNNIKKDSAKFWEDLLYFNILCRFMYSPQISAMYHWVRLGHVVGHDLVGMCITLVSLATSK